MATTTIPWNDGSGDYITLTYDSASGNQTVAVTSDANTGAARATTVYFSTGNISRQLVVEQEAGVSPVPTPIYEITSPVSTGNYDTGVKLFESPMSFTILCEASWNNYAWATNSNTQKNGIFGILDGSYNNSFKVGGVYQGEEYLNDTYNTKANRYTAIVMNDTTSGKMCSSLFARLNGMYNNRRIWVRYNATTRLVEAGSDVTPTTHKFTVSGDITTSATIRLRLNANTSTTVNVFRVYNQLLSDDFIDSFMSGQ